MDEFKELLKVTPTSRSDRVYNSIVEHELNWFNVILIVIVLLVILASI